MALQLFVFADESGIQETSPCCSLAGYIGSPRQWTAFEREWIAILKRYEIDAFRANLFFARDGAKHRVGPYKQWSDGRAQQFLHEVLEAIAHRRLSPIGCAVDVKPFQSLAYGERKFLTGGNVRLPGIMALAGAPSNPYFLALHHLVIDGYGSCAS